MRGDAFSRLVSLDHLLSVLKLSKDEIESILRGTGCYFDLVGDRFMVRADDKDYLAGLLVGADNALKSDTQGRLC